MVYFQKILCTEWSDLSGFCSEMVLDPDQIQVNVKKVLIH